MSECCKGQYVHAGTWLVNRDYCLCVCMCVCVCVCVCVYVSVCVCVYVRAVKLN